MLAPKPLQDEADTTPRRIGRYDVVGELGHGGMAVVYRAHDPRLEREVAVKVLHPHLARDAESRARFEREARAAARLRHPNIVEVYEFSDANERESYMVTELLEGPTLRRFADQHPGMPPEVVAAIGMVLCDALGCAHAQGVVHRDVKPDNVMLQSGGRLKLTDFGIAHVADMREMTATGQVLGSPAHMAPEQIEGEPVDARTDVFATGTVLYLLSVGRLPFDGTNAQSLLRKILEGDFVDPVRANPAVGERFAQVLRRAMARMPADRYPDMAAMRVDLAAYVAEVGWELPERELARYLADPDPFVAALRERLISRLPELGVAARVRNDVPAAMGYFNRALALDPANARVLALVRSVARRRALARRLRAAGIVTAVAFVTAVSVLTVQHLRSVAHGPSIDLREAVPVSPEAPLPSIAHVVHHTLGVPPAVSNTDASVALGPSEPRFHVRRSLPVSPVNTTVVATREVQLVPYPRNVRYQVGSGSEHTWDSQNPSLGFFPVGGAIHVRVIPSEGGSFTPLDLSPVIVAGDGPLRIQARLHEAAPRDATAAVVPEVPQRHL